SAFSAAIRVRNVPTERRRPLIESEICAVYVPFDRETMVPVPLVRFLPTRAPFRGSEGDQRRCLKFTATLRSQPRSQPPRFAGPLCGAFPLVGARGFEPLTSSASRK